MELARRRITLHRRDRPYSLLLIERDDIPEEWNIEYAKFVINTEQLTKDQLLDRFISLFTSLGDSPEESRSEAELLLIFCIKGVIEDSDYEEI